MRRCIDRHVRPALFLWALCAFGLQASLPPLVGDGVADDTAAIQARLDAGPSCVYLPPPKDHYVISRTLKVGSGRELRLDSFTRVRLAPKSDCPMLSNADLYGAGNEGVSVVGGVWDYDNARQSPNLLVAAPSRVPKKFDPNFHFGDIFRFDRITNLTVRGVTFRNPTTYSCHLTRAVHFTVEDVRFDFTTWNPQPLNMDGIHLDGGCHYGRISNLHGRCFDDMVALNANDGCCAAYEGEISDVDIDGLYADQTHRGVRLLSTDPHAPVRRVTIRNIHIRTYRNAVALTHFFPDRPGRGSFDAIAVRDCFASSAPAPDFSHVNTGAVWPMVWVQSGCDVGSLVVENLCRHETYSAKAPTIQVDDGARVETMTVRNCRLTRSIEACPEFFRGRSNVGTLSAEPGLVFSR